MTNDGRPCIDALVVGAGFYGCEIALELRRLGFKRVTLAEREDGIMRRASYVNQARVHSGYHYPRALVTAQRSRMNFEPFVAEYSDAIMFDAESVYAIARGSRVSAAQFETFCRTIDLPFRLAPRRITGLFDPTLIEEAFITREFVFDATRLAASLARRLAAAQVELCLNSECRVLGWDETGVDVRIGNRGSRAAYVFNCSYKDLGSVGIPLRARLKKELAEMLLIEPPPDLRALGITVMDGPFFSTMPFPAAGLHSLSHVRYTPHESMTDADSMMLRPTKSNREAMLRDSARYLPCLNAAIFVRSIFEVKVVLVSTEDDDARPILIETPDDTPRVVSVLGSKIDNIYDVRSFLRARDWSLNA
jgi:glycine/D-amino acid oxidase-like deaminating enzyme